MGVVMSESSVSAAPNVVAEVCKEEQKERGGREKGGRERGGRGEGGRERGGRGEGGREKGKRERGGREGERERAFNMQFR